MRQYSFAERVWFQSAFLILALIPAALIASQFDSRTLNDIPVWVKPIKFYVSTAVHLITLAILVRFFADGVRNALWLGIIAAISALATILEILPLTAQAARGVASHFNFSTQLDAGLYALMGIGAILMIIPALIIGLRFLWAPVSEKLTPGLKLGAGLGLTLGFILTLVIAGYMSMQPDGHWVNAPHTDHGSIPILGWSRQGGDLRVPHFFATHLMQVLPVLGYLGDKLFSNEGQTAKRVVWIAAIFGAGLTIVTFAQALAGQPFIR